VEVHLNFIGQFNPPLDGEPAGEEPFDPAEHRRAQYRASYYKHRDEILAKKAAEREQTKAAKLTAAPIKTPVEIAAEERQGVNATVSISGTISANGMRKNAPSETPNRPPSLQQYDSLTAKTERRLATKS
jgi:sRNA-binding protein